MENGETNTPEKGLKNSGFTLRKRIRSFRYAFNGVCLLITGEANVWIHCAAAVIVIGLGFALGLSRWEWVAVVFAIGSVFSAEAFNSSIEALADEVSEEYRERIKRTKDMAAGAVLLAAIAAAVIGCLIFLPKLLIINSQFSIL